MFRRRKAADGDDVGLEAHRFSMEAFGVAKTFVAGQAPEKEEAKAKAAELLERVPEVAGRAHAAPTDRQADLNRVLSDARLDLTFVISDGARPSSTRLARFRDDLGLGSGPG
jgi:hypothetical protein